MNISIAQEKKAPSEPDFLPVSVWYSGGKARAPMLSQITERSEQEWLADLKQIKQLGFNTVRTWVEWAHCEPHPGEYHFENLRLLCKLAQRVGLRVFIQLYVDSAPDWVGKNFPDGKYEAQNGAKVHSQAAPGFCTDHSGVRKTVTNFITQTAKIANEYPNFYGWDLWSEPHIVNWAYINYVPNVQFCFCPHTQQRFRDWLKKKYKNLGSLNDAWYRNFETWQEVQPPRFGTILSYTDFIDWKNFIYEKLADDLRLRHDAVRKADKNHVITSHAAVPSIFYSPYNGYGATDDFLMAEQIDFYGTSLYPKHNHPDRHWELWKFQLAVDFSRSANLNNGGFYVGELQAGKGTIGLNIGNPITPADHRIWMWSAIAKGARGINIYAYYPMSSGYESGGYGLINLDGSVTERAKNAGRIANFINQNMKLFLKSRPVKAQIALVYNPLAQMVGGEQRSISNDLHYTSLVGYYQYFVENNIPVDFIHRRDIEQGNISHYKLVIVPYPLMFTQTAANGLKQFVEQGGFVVAEARIAWNDERGFAAPVIPGMGLDEVFGVREADIKMVQKSKLTIVNQIHPSTKAFPTVTELLGDYFAESLEPLPNHQTTVLAKFIDNTPAIVASKYGKGETIIIGTFFGSANHPDTQPGNNRFLSGLLNWAKIIRPFTSSHDGKKETPVEIRLEENENGYVLFLLNHGQKAENVTVNLRVKQDGKFSLKEITTDQVKKLTAKNKELNLTMKLDSKNAAIWEIKQ